MLLTGFLTTQIESGPLTLKQGDIFQLNHEDQQALGDVVITFTGLVLHSYPPQLEIDQIKGPYMPLA
jgi:hypothetical protein